MTESSLGEQVLIWDVVDGRVIEAQQRIADLQGRVRAAVALTAWQSASARAFHDRAADWGLALADLDREFETVRRFIVHARSRAEWLADPWG